MQEQRVCVITLGVADLAVSRSFYVDGFWWEVAHNPGLVTDQTGKVAFLSGGAE